MISTAVGVMMFERLNMLMRVACLYVNRPKRLDLLKQIKASDLSDEDRARIIDIMQRMRIIREADWQTFDSSEPPSSPLPSFFSKAQRQGNG
jgi:hypothetical protein